MGLLPAGWLVVGLVEGEMQGVRGSRGGYGGTLGPLLGSLFRHMLDGSLISPFPPCCFLRRFVGNGLPVLYPLPLPPVPGNVPMGIGSVQTHLELGQSTKSKDLFSTETNNYSK